MLLHRHDKWEYLKGASPVFLKDFISSQGCHHLTCKQEEVHTAAHICIAKDCKSKIEILYPGLCSKKNFEVLIEC